MLHDQKFKTKKLKYLENKKFWVLSFENFWVEIKSIIHHFRLKPESPPSRYNIILKISLHILITCKFRLKLYLLIFRFTSSNIEFQMFQTTCMLLAVLEQAHMQPCYMLVLSLHGAIILNSFDNVIGTVPL